MSFTYIASPYTHPNEDVIQSRYLVTLAYTSFLLHNKKYVFSPIVHCHPLAVIANIPRNFSFWRHYNEAMLSKAKKLIVLQLPGWKQSQGVNFETAYAIGKDIPIAYRSFDEIREIVIRYPNTAQACATLAEYTRGPVISQPRIKKEQEWTEDENKTLADELGDYMQQKLAGK